jgi:hypothetical protein
MISLDNGPVAKSQVFQKVMRYLDIEVRAHLPQANAGHARRPVRVSEGWRRRADAPPFPL